MKMKKKMVLIKLKKDILLRKCKSKLFKMLIMENNKMMMINRRRRNLTKIYKMMTMMI